MESRRKREWIRPSGKTPPPAKFPPWAGSRPARRAPPERVSLPDDGDNPLSLQTDWTDSRDLPSDIRAVDFLSRPFDPVELLVRVHSALRTKAYLDLLEQRAHIDGLTELSNRHALQNRLPQEWDTCLRRGHPLAILILDLDHFKRI